MALLTVKFYSSILNRETQMNVILPTQSKNFDLQSSHTADTLKNYPVLYLLHGLGDSYEHWCSCTSIEQYVENTGIAVIMPDGSTNWYTDMKKGERWRAFIGEELPAVCHELFPQLSTKREDTYIGGVSMGGYGAYALALTYPERYGAACGFSGAYTPFGDSIVTQLISHWTDVFGEQEEWLKSKNDLVYLSEQLISSGRPLPKLWMWCGFKDFLYRHSTDMRDHLQNIGWPDFHYEESEGDHSWIYWNMKSIPMLEWILEDRKTK